MNDEHRDEFEWRRSSRCADGACAEVMDDGAGGVLLRSSLHQEVVVRLTVDEWSAFRAGVKRGDFG